MSFEQIPEIKIEEEQPERFIFPAGQLSFGAASCAFQSEGNNFNSDWHDHMNEEHARYLASIAHRKDFGQGKIKNLPPEAFDLDNYLPGQCVDYFNRFSEDHRLCQELGLENLHSGFEWSRIQPVYRSGKVPEYDMLAVRKYQHIIDDMKAHGMEPIMDLFHFSLPLWARDLGGWSNDEVVTQFAEFAGFMAEQFKDKINYWSTINEPDTYALATRMPFPIPKNTQWLSYQRGWNEFFKTRRNLILGHQLAYQAIKGVDKDAQVGFTTSFAYYDGWKGPVSSAIRKAMSTVTNELYVKDMAKYADFVGAQYYCHFRVKGPNYKANDFKRVSDQGWDLYPEGHYHLLKWLSTNVTKQHGIPIFITETGVADRDDKNRSWYIDESVRYTEEAMADGIDVRVFDVWDKTDSFEWDRGRQMRYGLIEVDYDNDLERRIRDGGHAYARLIQQRKAAREIN